MKRMALIGLLLAGATQAQTTGQDTSWRNGDRMAGTVGASPQGQAVIPKVQQTTASGTAVPAGTAADPIYTSGGAAVPTGSAGNPSPAVVTVQGITNGTPQNVQGVTGGVPLMVAGGSSVPISGYGYPLGLSVLSAPFVYNGTSGELERSANGANGTTGTGLLGVGDLLWNGTSYTRFASDTNGYAYVTSKGSATLATNQVSVGTTATLIRAADPGRTSITVIVGAANSCAFGNSGVTLTTGYLLPATAGATDTTATSAALYGVCSATTTISYKVVLP